MRKTPGNVLIGPITPADFSEVRSIEHRGQTAPWSDDSLETELTNANAFHFGMYSAPDRRLLAFVLARILFDEVHIHRVCTHPAGRRAGCARTLLSHALEAARSRGAKKAFLEVASSNTAAIALYRGSGFTEDTVREHYYSTGDDAIVMSKQLDAPETPKGSTR